jgi:GNAT superfamily N-acetyltransferase
MSNVTWTISTLRQRPAFADTVASRGWHAWWTDSPVPLTEYRSWVQDCCVGSGIPAALVAHDGAIYLGSANLIASDMETRPQYTPWIAALWVDEAQRSRGIAAALIDAARAEARTLGIGTVYLCASRANAPYYLARGFTRIEEDVDGLNVLTIGA